MRRSVLSSMAARLGQGVQQMRSEQARHGSELNENLRAEQRRWRTSLADVQAQQGEQQQLLEALEARLEAVEALAKEPRPLEEPRAREPRAPRREEDPPRELRPPEAQAVHPVEHQPQPLEPRVEESRFYHPHPEMVKRLEVGLLDPRRGPRRPWKDAFGSQEADRKPLRHPGRS